ncbi:DUF6527 family protein [Oceaniglobus trochenteri]|uniref:DUF6527 family protein n=1 Tax=Oceaniglobus trochenteri TaxID=2763260 RepID=UPI001D001655|nr:DUF6527 family protein [Oceaniglobus trochenteri]
MSLRALHYTDRVQFECQANPGSFMLESRRASGRFEFVYFCPCGCGLKNRLLIGELHKPTGPRPSWRWNGSRTAPSLDPSVHHIDHWHGWLRDGYWEVC